MAPRCQLLSGSLSSTFRLLGARSFSTSTPLHGRKGGDLGSHLPRHVIPRDANIPPYPHGSAKLFRQSDRGLYGGQKIQFGNNVSPRTKTKTRRFWKPNVVTKGFYSIALKKRIKLRVTSSVLKTMDREGGLDEYLLKESATRVEELGPLGWALRWTLMQQPEVIARFRAEAAELGIPQHIIDERWPLTSPARKETALRKADRLRQEALKQQEKKETSEAKAAVLKRRHTTRVMVDNFATEYQKSNIAPDRGLAWAIARDRVAKFRRQVALAGGTSAYWSWMRAKSNGKLARAGSDEQFFAKRQAGLILKRQAKGVQYPAEESVEHGGGEASNEGHMEPHKDEWASLVDGKRPNL